MLDETNSIHSCSPYCQRPPCVAAREKAATAVSEEPVVWKPIATAPKDNKRALYLARFDSDGKLQELDFDGIGEHWQESWEMPHIQGRDWCSANGIVEPTHWAYQDEPLPLLPSEALQSAFNRGAEEAHAEYEQVAIVGTGEPPNMLGEPLYRRKEKS